MDFVTLISPTTWWCTRQNVMKCGGFTGPGVFLSSNIDIKNLFNPLMVGGFTSGFAMGYPECTNLSIIFCGLHIQYRLYIINIIYIYIHTHRIFIPLSSIIHNILEIQSMPFAKISVRNEVRPSRPRLKADNSAVSQWPRASRASRAHFSPGSHGVLGEADSKVRTQREPKKNWGEPSIFRCNHR